MSPLTSDACPRCGARQLPVLDARAGKPGSGPVPADPPVRLVCASCPPAEAPPLSG
ncbi:hypothetical protein [Nocardioides litoris]|uniref:hypothetical protein n=1 Tax=Nocardioides litoris TaxID=1926648 RepID=UPI001476A4BC|nr:hypothetical protein [Nocardioides litoris]